MGAQWNWAPSATVKVELLAVAQQPEDLAALLGRGYDEGVAGVGGDEGGGGDPAGDIGDGELHDG
jgi:hypothetical protein